MKKTIFFPDELIGEEIEVVASCNPNDVGITGKVVDETKSTLKIKVKTEQIKILLKRNITFQLLDSGQVLTGKDLLKRPEERIKN